MPALPFPVRLIGEESGDATRPPSLREAFGASNAGGSLVGGAFKEGPVQTPMAVGGRQVGDESADDFADIFSPSRIADCARQLASRFDSVSEEDRVLPDNQLGLSDEQLQRMVPGMVPDAGHGGQDSQSQHRVDSQFDTAAPVEDDSHHRCDTQPFVDIVDADITQHPQASHGDPSRASEILSFSDMARLGDNGEVCDSVPADDGAGVARWAGLSMALVTQPEKSTKLEIDLARSKLPDEPPRRRRRVQPVLVLGSFQPKQEFQVEEREFQVEEQETLESRLSPGVAAPPWRTPESANHWHNELGDVMLFGCMALDTHSRLFERVINSTVRPIMSPMVLDEELKSSEVKAEVAEGQNPHLEHDDAFLIHIEVLQDIVDTMRQAHRSHRQSDERTFADFANFLREAADPF